MRLGLDVSPLLGTRAGIGIHVEQNLKALLALAPEHEYYLYSPRPLPELDAAAVGRYPNARIICWPPAFMRWRVWWDGVDIFHGMNYKLRGRGRAGAVMTVHDLALDRIPQPSRKLLGQRRSFRRTQRTALSAARVIAVSECTAKDIAELYGVPRKRIAVIANGAGTDFYPVTDKDALERVRVRYGIRDAFVLATGGPHPRKNARRIIEAFASEPDLRHHHHLVIVGAMDRGGEAMRDAARRAGLEGVVIFPGHVPAEDLRVLYSSCAVFVFPSLYEGFGMPVVEAMACGAPVICSNSSALPEVAGGAAVLIDPGDGRAIAGAIKRLLSDPDTRDELRRRGLLRAKAFSWERSARELLKVYEDVIGENHRAG